MKTKRSLRSMIAGILLTTVIAVHGTVCAFENPVSLARQGSFAVGGRVISDGKGNAFHGDHGYVFYQVPTHARKYPLIFVHGIYQFSKTWESTPDGRDGFQNMFLAKGYATYNLTMPRRGNAGRATESGKIDVVFDEALWFNRFRLGIWPDYFPDTQFPRENPDALNQYFRQITPNTAAFDHEAAADTLAALFERIGEGILVPHSQGGKHTWMAIPRTDKIKGVVAWEPGGFYTFSDDEPDPKIDFEIAEQFKTNEYIKVEPDVFEKFTKMPILIIYGDHIPGKPCGNPEQDEWGVRLQLARLWRDAVNRRGGDVTVIHLPELGYHGNTHFPFSDKNNREMAKIMENWLHEKGLDAR